MNEQARSGDRGVQGGAAGDGELSGELSSWRSWSGNLFSTALRGKGDRAWYRALRHELSGIVLWIDGGRGDTGRAVWLGRQGRQRDGGGTMWLMIGCFVAGVVTGAIVVVRIADRVGERMIGRWFGW